MKKKILFFSDCFIFGGCEIVLTNLMKSDKLLSNYDIQFAYRSFKEYNEALQLHNLKNVKLTPLSLISFSSYFYRNQLSGGSFYSRHVNFLIKIIKKTRVDYIYNYLRLSIFLLFNNADILVVNNGGYPGSDLSRMCITASRFTKIKHVFFIINNMAYEIKNRKELKKDAIINKSVDLFITASNAARLELCNKRNFPLNNILNIPNTVKISNSINENILHKEFNITNEIILASVGLLTKRKGFEILIKAIGELKKTVNQNVSYKLIIFGDGEEKKYLSSLIKNLELENIIILAGFRNNILDYMKDIDVLIVPSISNEDMPYVIIEAMMLKKPIIGTQVAGIPEEIIDGKTGFLIQPNDIESLADRMRILINDFELRKTMGRNSYNLFLNKFEYELIINKYFNLFNSYINKNNISNN